MYVTNIRFTSQFVDSTNASRKEQKIIVENAKISKQEMIDVINVVFYVFYVTVSNFLSVELKSSWLISTWKMIVKDRY